MKKLLAAFAFIGLVACGGGDSASSREAPVEEAPAGEKKPVDLDLDAILGNGGTFEAAARKCPTYAPRCCGLLRPDGTCVGNCVARNAECP
jgi:hypothetical protein